MSKSRQRRLAFFLLGALLAYMLYASNAHAGLMGGVGHLMGPPSGGASTPGGGFAIITEDGDPIVTEDGSYIVTEDAP